MEKCAECGREFGDIEALKNHSSAKHATDSGKKMPGAKKSHIAVLAVIVILAAVAIAGYQYFSTPGKNDGFAQCISEKGAIFYGAFWCPHCKEQKEMFSSSIKYVNYVECSTPDGRSQKPECRSEGIESYPTWVFSDGSKETGVLSFSALAEKTSCIIS